MSITSPTGVVTFLFTDIERRSILGSLSFMPPLRCVTKPAAPTTVSDIRCSTHPHCQWSIR